MSLGTPDTKKYDLDAYAITIGVRPKGRNGWEAAIRSASNVSQILPNLNNRQMQSKFT